MSHHSMHPGHSSRALRDEPYGRRRKKSDNWGEFASDLTSSTPSKRSGIIGSVKNFVSSVFKFIAPTKSVDQNRKYVSFDDDVDDDDVDGDDNEKIVLSKAQYNKLLHNYSISALKNDQKQFSCMEDTSQVPSFNFNPDSSYLRQKPFTFNHLEVDQDFLNSKDNSWIGDKKIEAEESTRNERTRSTPNTPMIGVRNKAVNRFTPMALKTGDREIATSEKRSNSSKDYRKIPDFTLNSLAARDSNRNKRSRVYNDDNDNNDNDYHDHDEKGSDLMDYSEMDSFSKIKKPLKLDSYEPKPCKLSHSILPIRRVWKNPRMNPVRMQKNNQENNSDNNNNNRRAKLTFKLPPCSRLLESASLFSSVKNKRINGEIKSGDGNLEVDEEFVPSKRNIYQESDLVVDSDNGIGSSADNVKNGLSNTHSHLNENEILWNHFSKEDKSKENFEFFVRSEVIDLDNEDEKDGNATNFGSGDTKEKERLEIASTTNTTTTNTNTRSIMNNIPMNSGSNGEMMMKDIESRKSFEDGLDDSINNYGAKKRVSLFSKVDSQVDSEINFSKDHETSITNVNKFVTLNEVDGNKAFENENPKTYEESDKSPIKSSPFAVPTDFSMPMPKKTQFYNANGGFKVPSQTLTSKTGQESMSEKSENNFMFGFKVPEKTSKSPLDGYNSGSPNINDTEKAGISDFKNSITGTKAGLFDSNDREKNSKMNAGIFGFKGIDEKGNGIAAGLFGSEKVGEKMFKTATDNNNNNNNNDNNNNNNNNNNNTKIELFGSKNSDKIISNGNKDSFGNKSVKSENVLLAAGERANGLNFNSNTSNSDTTDETKISLENDSGKKSVLFDLENTTEKMNKEIGSFGSTISVGKETVPPSMDAGLFGSKKMDELPMQKSFAAATNNNNNNNSNVLVEVNSNDTAAVAKAPDNINKTGELFESNNNNNNNEIIASSNNNNNNNNNTIGVFASKGLNSNENNKISELFSSKNTNNEVKQTFSFSNTTNIGTKGLFEFKNNNEISSNVTANTTSGLFGSKNTGDAVCSSANSTIPSGLFGSKNPNDSSVSENSNINNSITTELFGSKNNTSNEKNSATPNASAAFTTGLFKNENTANETSPSSNNNNTSTSDALFGSNNKSNSTNTTGSGLFGSNTSEVKATSSSTKTIGLFESKNSGTKTSELFGSTAKNNESAKMVNTGIFGSKNTNETITAGLFGKNSPHNDIKGANGFLGAVNDDNNNNNNNTGLFGSSRPLESTNYDLFSKFPQNSTNNNNSNNVIDSNSKIFNNQTSSVFGDVNANSNNNNNSIFGKSEQNNINGNKIGDLSNFSPESKNIFKGIGDSANLSGFQSNFKSNKMGFGSKSSQHKNTNSMKFNNNNNNNNTVSLFASVSSDNNSSSNTAIFGQFNKTEEKSDLKISSLFSSGLGSSGIGGGGFGSTTNNSGGFLSGGFGPVSNTSSSAFGSSNNISGGGFGSTTNTSSGFNNNINNSTGANGGFNSNNTSDQSGFGSNSCNLFNVNNYPAGNNTVGTGVFSNNMPINSQNNGLSSAFGTQTNMASNNFGSVAFANAPSTNTNSPFANVGCSDFQFSQALPGSPLTSSNGNFFNSNPQNSSMNTAFSFKVNSKNKLRARRRA